MKEKRLKVEGLNGVLVEQIKLFNRSTNQLLNRKKAFTLAEVLITLGVIRVEHVV